MGRRFKVYKGLQRPLVYRGFKGKYIYYSIAALLAGLVLGAVTIALVNMWLGVLVLIASVTGGICSIAFKQKSGLYDKSRDRNLFIHQVNFRRLNRYDRKTSI